jgi:O-antigen/teichoic acid export membrane protein
VFRQISGLAGASALSQALVILAAPVLTRLYSPEDFASYYLVASIAAFFATVISGRLETAIPLPSSDKTGMALMAAATFLATVLVLIVAAFCLTIPNTIASILGDSSLQSIIWLIPVAAFFTSCTKILTFVLVRTRRYRPMGINTILEAITATGTQVITPFTAISFSGLLLSLILTPIAACGFLFYSLRKTLEWVPVKTVRNAVSAFKEYPIYGVPISIVNSAASPLLIWFIFRHHGPEIAGLYALSQRILLTPATIIREAIRKVFWGEITELIRTNPRRVIPLFSSILWKLLVFATPFVILTIIYSEQVVTFVFGDSWRGAGYIIAVLAPMATISLATTALANFSMIGLQKLGLVWSSIQLLMVVILLATATLMNLEFKQFIVAYSAIMISTYVLLVVMWIAGARTFNPSP